jgi:hypothetical protein
MNGRKARIWLWLSAALVFAAGLAHASIGPLMGGAPVVVGAAGVLALGFVVERVSDLIGFLWRERRADAEAQREIDRVVGEILPALRAFHQQVLNLSALTEPHLEALDGVELPETPTEALLASRHEKRQIRELRRVLRRLQRFASWFRRERDALTDAPDLAARWKAAVFVMRYNSGACVQEVYADLSRLVADPELKRQLGRGQESGPSA